MGITDIGLKYEVMYITEVLTKTQKGEISHRCILLRESYREGGKVKNRTIANLTHSNPNEVAAMRLALAHKDDRYKDLAEVEQAFRTCKTGLLQMRPWYVQLEKSTRGHALVVMLAYLITHALQQAWANFDLTVEEGLKELSTLCSMEMRMKGQGSCHRIPTPRQTSVQLLQAAAVRLPHVLPCLGATAVSRKKLPTRRRKH